MSLKTGYKQIALPVDLVLEIQKFIDSHPEQGYMSVPEFVREAIRIYLKQKQNA